MRLDASKYVELALARGSGAVGAAFGSLGLRSGAASLEGALGPSFGAAMDAFTEYQNLLMDHSVVPMPAVDSAVADLVSASGLPEGSLRFLLALLATYPLASLACLLPRGITRHIADAVAGAFILQFVFGGAWVFVPVSAVLAWAALQAGAFLFASQRRGKAKEPSKEPAGEPAPALGATPWWHVAAIAVACVFLFYRHIVRPPAGTASIDDCAAQMVLVAKLCSLAFAAYDGGEAERAAATALVTRAATDAAAAAETKAAASKYPMDDALRAAAEAASKTARNSQRQSRVALGRLATCLPRVPSLFETLGYALCPQTCLAGPSFQMALYLNGAAAFELREGTEVPLASPGTAGIVRPSRLPRALFLFLSGLFFLGVNVPLAAMAPLDALYDPSVPVPLLGALGYTAAAAGGSPAELAIEREAGAPPASLLGGSESGSGSSPDLVALALVAYLALVSVRLQYYGVWLLAEGAGVLAGYGFVEGKAEGKGASHGGAGAAAEGKVHRMAVKAAGDPAEQAPHTADGMGVGPVSGRGQGATSVTSARGSAGEGSSAGSSAQTDPVPGTRVKGSGSGSSGGHWMGISNIDVVQCEFSPSLSTVIRNWNKQIQGWLLKDVYGRFPPGSPWAKFATLGASALWHGFYTGYYVGFFQVMLAQAAQSAVYTMFRPILSGAYNEGTDGASFLAWLGSFVGVCSYRKPRFTPGRPHLPMWAVPVACFFVSIGLNYSMAPFPLLYLERGMGFYRNARFLLHPVMVAAVVLEPVVATAYRALGIGGGRGKGKGKGKEKDA